jgi:alpha-galactosidase
MTEAEARAQMTMWAVVAAPLILGSDPRELSPAAIKMLTNREVIQVDQDHLGIQGTRVQEEGSAQIWVKPLTGGERAVALLNRGSTELTMTTTPRTIRIAQARRYAVENLWTHRTITATGEISARVAPHAAVLYRVTTR